MALTGRDIYEWAHYEELAKETSHIVKNDAVPEELITRIKADFPAFGKRIPKSKNQSEYNAFINTLKATYLIASQMQEQEGWDVSDKIVNRSIALAASILNNTQGNWLNIEKDLSDFIPAIQQQPLIRYFAKDVVNHLLSPLINIEDNNLTNALLPDMAEAFFSNRTPATILDLSNQWLVRRTYLEKKYAIDSDARWHPLINPVQVPSYGIPPEFEAAKGFYIIPLCTKREMEDEGRIQNVCTGSPMRIDEVSKGKSHRLSIRDKNGSRLCTLPIEMHSGHSPLAEAINLPNGQHLIIRELATFRHEHDNDPPAGVTEAINWLKAELQKGRINIVWRPGLVEINEKPDRTERLKKAHTSFDMFSHESGLKAGNHYVIPNAYRDMQYDEFLKASGLQAAMVKVLHKSGYSMLAREIEKSTSSLRDR